MTGVPPPVRCGPEFPIHGLGFRPPFYLHPGGNPIRFAADFSPTFFPPRRLGSLKVSLFYKVDFFSSLRAPSRCATYTLSSGFIFLRFTGFPVIGVFDGPASTCSHRAALFPPVASLEVRFLCFAGACIIGGQSAKL